jgi:plasmid stabilization system protein ParE
MSYTIIWRPAAENQLATLWTSSPDRNAVARAADAVDDALARDPLNEGESRTGSLRVTFQPPLIVYFRVRPQQHLVTVLSVRRMRRPPTP